MKAQLLDSARRAFPGFYAAATPPDRALMDCLVMARAALTVGINAPREHVAAALRAEVEKTTDAAERVFTELRERVRACPTFASVSAGEQVAIEREMFSPPRMFD